MNNTIPIDYRALAAYSAVNWVKVGLDSTQTIFNILFLILWFPLKKYEPLKSRGILPPILLFFMFIVECTNFVTNYNYTPLVALLGVVPLQVGTMSMVWAVTVISYVRYFAKQALERAKINNNVNNTRIYKSLSLIFISNWGLVLATTISLFVVGTLCMGMWISLFVTNTFYSAGIDIDVTIVICEIVCIIVVIITDIVTDTIRYGCCSGAYSHRDPLNYRVDALLLLGVVFAGLLYMIIFFISSDIQVTQGINSAYVGMWLVEVLLDQLQRCLFLLVGGGSCIIIITKRAIIYRIRASQEKALPKLELMMKTMENSDGREAMFKYSEGEFSIENCRAYDDLRKYEDTKNAEEKLKLAIFMVDTYVKEGQSLLQVNLSEKVRKQVIADVERAESDSKILDTLFNEFTYELRTNLLDTFSRFMLSDIYRDYKRQQRESLKV
jgi:hypothetical protein